MPDNTGMDNSIVQCQQRNVRVHGHFSCMTVMQQPVDDVEPVGDHGYQMDFVFLRKFSDALFDVFTRNCVILKLDSWKKILQPFRATGKLLPLLHMQQFYC